MIFLVWGVFLPVAAFAAVWFCDYVTRKISGDVSIATFILERAVLPLSRCIYRLGQILHDQLVRLKNSLPLIAEYLFPCTMSLPLFWIGAIPPMVALDCVLLAARCLPYIRDAILCTAVSLVFNPCRCIRRTTYAILMCAFTFIHTFVRCGFIDPLVRFARFWFDGRSIVSSFFATGSLFLSVLMLIGDPIMGFIGIEYGRGADVSVGSDPRQFHGSDRSFRKTDPLLILLVGIYVCGYILLHIVATTLLVLLAVLPFGCVIIDIFVPAKWINRFLCEKESTFVIISMISTMFWTISLFYMFLALVFLPPSIANKYLLKYLLCPWLFSYSIYFQRRWGVANKNTRRYP